jgi:anti-sigma factor RsiW
MSCELQQERISARLSGELDRAQLAELEVHLAGCADCAAHAVLIEELWRGLAEPASDLPGEPGVPTERMRARFTEMLAGELAAQAAPATEPVPFVSRKVAPPLFTSRLLQLAAMLLVGLGLGYFAFGRQDADVASLQREVGDLHEMVALSLL